MQQLRIRPAAPKEGARHEDQRAGDRGDLLHDGTGGGLHTTYYDEFGTWTHYWGTWTGTGKFTGNEVTQFIHLNYGWNEEGKIFYHNVHIDGKDFLAEVNAAQAASGSE